jgi:hypothetical protein
MRPHPIDNDVQLRRERRADFDADSIGFLFQFGELRGI